MSDGKTYVMKQRRDLWRTEGGGGVVFEVTPSDVPTLFTVTVSRDGELTIRFQYPGGTAEPTTWSKMDRVDCEIGVHSRRLFAVNVQLPALRSPQEFEDALRSALSRALSMLQQRTPYGGPRMNYRIAGAGLGIEDASSMSEAWMVDALERMRVERPSGSGSHR